MNLTNDPKLWEVLGAILILVFAAPFVFLIYLAIHVCSCASKEAAQSGKYGERS